MASIKWDGGSEIITPTRKIIPLFGESSPKNPVICFEGTNVVIRQDLDKMDIAPAIKREEYEEGVTGELIKTRKIIKEDGSRTEIITMKHQVSDAVIEFSQSKLSDLLPTSKRVNIF